MHGFVTNGLILAIVCFSIVVAGCGARNERQRTLVRVSGTVTLNGEPVSGALVVYSPVTDGHPAAQGTTDENGTYRLTTFDTNDGVPPGKYKILVTKKTMTNSMTAQESREYFSTSGEAPPIPEFHNELPEQYSLHNTTELSTTVEETKSVQVNLALKD